MNGARNLYPQSIEPVSAQVAFEAGTNVNKNNQQAL